MTRSEAKRYRTSISAVIDALEDKDALDVMELFMPWKTGKYYPAGARTKHGGKLYVCLQAHTSQDDWTPDITPALWKEVTVEEWPEWKQPAGSADAYRIGAKVSHDGKHWINEYDYNIYAPGVYGWAEA